MSEKLVKLRTQKKRDVSEKIDRKTLSVVRRESLPIHSNVGGGELTIYRDGAGKLYIERTIERNNVRNMLDQYELIDDGKITLKPLTLEIANQIIERVLTGESFNGCFVFGEVSSRALQWVKSEQEHKYTSTGVKFWRHQQQMFEHRRPIDGAPRNTVVSTHISPEGACNLRCPYCAVSYRDTHSRIDLSRVKRYVEDLKARGLKAVILTGGGEPTLYPHFNELVQWLKHDQGLSVALITNGTTGQRITDETLQCFSWVRISINTFPGWQESIALKHEALQPSCVVGCSMVYTVEHEARDVVIKDRLDVFRSVSRIADRVGAKYVRLLPNCLLEQDKLLFEHENLQRLVSELGDDRFFQQYKVHGTPSCGTCHQSYFRPYLSEEQFGQSGIPGTVYPCDSVVLNDSVTHFAKKYQLCRPEDVVEYIDRRIEANFDPRIDCTGCVFTDNVNMLDAWSRGEIDRFSEFQLPLIHEEFV